MVLSMMEIISGRTETGRGIDHDLCCFLWAQKFVPFIMDHINDPEEKYHLHYISMREVRKVNLLEGIKVSSNGNVFMSPGTKISDVRRAFI